MSLVSEVNSHNMMFVGEFSLKVYSFSAKMQSNTIVKTIV